MSAKHTPTPWRASIKSNNRIIPFDNEFFTIAETSGFNISEAGANRDFIVRAVNSHDDLLVALKDADAMMTVIECGHQKPLGFGQVLDSVRAEIRKATKV